MKKIYLLSGSWLLVISLFLGSMQVFSQENSYTCKVICANQSDHVMEGVQVDLYDSNDSFLETSFTDALGYFTFDDLTIGNSYTAKFTYDAENTYADIADVYVLLSYLGGDVELDEYRLISADVNGDSQVDGNDFMTMLVDYYIMQIPFPVGNWYLPDWDFTVTADKATGGPTYGSVNGQLEEDDPDKDYYQSLFNYSPMVEVEQEEISIPLSFSENMETSGISLALAYNTDLIEVTRVESIIEGINYHVNDGEIRIAWADYNNSYQFNADETLVNVFIKQKTSNSMDQIERFSLLEDSKVLRKNGEKYSYVEFNSPEFNLKSNIINNNQEFAYPNPCTTHFNINIDNQNEEDLDLLIYNSLGQLIYSENINQIDSQKQVDVQNFENGVYFYQINYQAKVLTGSITVRH